MDKRSSEVLDSNVPEERVIAKIRKRRAFGVQKYGQGLERTDFSRMQWLIHAQEESMDFAGYLEKLIELETINRGDWKIVCNALKQAQQELQATARHSWLDEPIAIAEQHIK